MVCPVTFYNKIDKVISDINHIDTPDAILVVENQLEICTDRVEHIDRTTTYIGRPLGLQAERDIFESIATLLQLRLNELRRNPEDEPSVAPEHMWPTR